MIKHLEAERRFDAQSLTKVSLFETERMFMDLYCLEPGQSQRRHAHAGADKVYVVLEGTARVQVGDEEFDVPPSHAVLAGAGVDHGLRNITGERVVVLVFMAPNPNRPSGRT